MTTDTLQQLWDSTAALYARFGLDAASVPPSKRRRFLNEEVLELMEASTKLNTWVCYDDDHYFTIGDEADVAGEAADVLVTVIGLLQAHGLTPDDLRAACGRVAAKNDAKTEANGYGVSGGKIRKVEAQP